MLTYGGNKGAVAFWKSEGLWSAEDEAHNQNLLKRQSVIASAWEGMADKTEDGFKERWMAARFQALTDAGMPAVWEK